MPWTRPLADLLLPPTCVLCGAPGLSGVDLCPGCAADLPRNRVHCARCALPLGGAAGDALCGACQRRPPPYDRCRAPLRYEGAVPALVSMAKFRGRLNALRVLGRVLGESLAPLPGECPEVLLPVPLHPRRLRERGYNQAHELAREVGRVLAIPVSPGFLERHIATAPQAGLDERARRRNVRGAFAVRGTLPFRRVAIVDDVVTTGSTVAELARVLRAAGAVQVEVWAVARTP
jgi:ComF family protein